MPEERNPVIVEAQRRTSRIVNDVIVAKQHRLVNEGKITLEEYDRRLAVLAERRRQANNGDTSPPESRD